MKKRHGVLGLLCCVSVITFVDRLAIPVAAPGISRELRLSPAQWGWVLSAYVLANAVFEIPSGAFGDREGQRLELTRITVWWSCFTALTGWCRSFWQIVGVAVSVWRGCGGGVSECRRSDLALVSQAGARRARRDSCGRRAGWAARWLRCCWCPLQRAFGWRAIFWLLGGVGLVWAVVWWSWFRDRSGGDAWNHASELDEIGVGEREAAHAASSVGRAVSPAAALADCVGLLLLCVGKLVLLRLVHHLAGARRGLLRRADGPVRFVSIS